MPLHKGDDVFMSDKQCEAFYWATLKKVVLGLIEEGIMPVLFTEGRYNNRLEIFKDLPRDAVIWQFDQTNMTEAKKSSVTLPVSPGMYPHHCCLPARPKLLKNTAASLSRFVVKAAV